MQIHKITQDNEQWLDYRKGKITGSKVKDLIIKQGNTKKAGFFQLMADRLAVDDGIEDGIDRGNALEQAAIDMFQENFGKEVEQDLFCVSDRNENLALSPDGLIKNKGKYTEAIEAKCLKSANHLAICYYKKVPNEHMDQVIHYFVVNEDLEKLYFISYDPRIQAKPMMVVEVTREELVDQIEDYYNQEIEQLAEIDEFLTELTF